MDISSSLVATNLELTDMVPDCSCILCIWIVVVFVLARQRIVCCPSIKGSTIVLAMHVDGRICWTDVVEPYNSL